MTCPRLQVAKLHDMAKLSTRSLRFNFTVYYAHIIPVKQTEALKMPVFSSVSLSNQFTFFFDFYFNTLKHIKNITCSFSFNTCRSSLYRMSLGRTNQGE
jgi:hypothetical protein